jgi:hypothetical protein
VSEQVKCMTIFEFIVQTLCSDESVTSLLAEKRAPSQGPGVRGEEEEEIEKKVR